MVALVGYLEPPDLIKAYGRVIYNLTLFKYNPRWVSFRTLRISIKKDIFTYQLRSKVQFLHLLPGRQMQGVSRSGELLNRHEESKSTVRSCSVPKRNTMFKQKQLGLSTRTGVHSDERFQGCMQRETEERIFL
jgi:hypothetical protein